MTSATEGGSTPTGAGNVEFAAASLGANRPRLRWWLVPFIGMLAIFAALVWALGGSDEPAALVTATDATNSSAATTSPTTSAPTSLTPSDDGEDEPVDSADIETNAATTTDANADRPMVPGSTTTISPTSSIPPSTVVPSTVLVSATADTNAPPVSIVDDAVTEAIVIDPVPNTSLDAADRTPASTVPATSVVPLTCDAPIVRLDAAALIDTGRITAENADGTPAAIAVTASGIGVAGGRDDERIDYSAARGASERIFVDLGGARCAVSIDITDLDDGEWNGIAESAHWVGLDGDGRTVGEGWLLGPADSPVELAVNTPINRLLIEAAPYGATADGWPDGADREATDNSDFVLATVIVR